MNPCYERTDDLLRYLDNELSGKRLENLFVHLKTCVPCSTWLEEQRELSRVLRKSRPLYSAPAELRYRVSDIVSQHSMAESSNGTFLQRLSQALRLHFTGFVRFVPRVAILAPALLVIVVCLTLAPNIVRQVHAASYVETAVSTHRSYLAGGLPLEIRSSSPEEVMAWLADKVSFPFRLPDSQADLGSKPAYRLVGARLVPYKGSQAALVTYEGTATKDTISLLVASSNSAVVAGGDEVRSGSLTFHYRSDSGFKVITWSTHGLSYALVSNVSGSAHGSCLVCHQNMADHDAFSSGQ